MIKTMRKGAKVRYIGNDEDKKELYKDQIFTVIQKEYKHITISAPMRYLGGSIHYTRCSLPIEDFELIK